MKEFWKGVCAGAGGVLAAVLGIAACRFFLERDRKIYERMEERCEIQAMQEDINNRPSSEFLEDPGIRRAADNAAADFQRKRDEAVRAIRRSRIAR